jgi:diacylglycerol O-acyltransferase / wax synthase
VWLGEPRGTNYEMEQLSWTDDMMLRAERPETPMQIQMLLIYDQSTAPDGTVTFKRILEEIDARLHLAPTFRRRLTDLPGSLHMPYWVDDPNFDLEYHVRHIALPQPGDWRQLCIQIARIHGRQLDLRRPPWEMTVIEGLNSVPGVPRGSFAISIKLHHCVVDGMESVELMAAMHDLAPDSARPAPPEKPWNPRALPSTADLLSRTAINGVLHPLRAGKVLIPGAIGALRHIGDRARFNQSRPFDPSVHRRPSGPPGRSWGRSERNPVVNKSISPRMESANVSAPVPPLSVSGAHYRDVVR